MAYTKLFKVCQNFALGKQTINTAIANMEQFFTGWTAEHSKAEPPLGATQPNPYEAFGVHVLEAVPRAMVLVTPHFIGPGQTGFTVNPQPTVVSVSRLGTGQYLIKMDGNLATFFGHAMPQQASGDTRFCKAVGTHSNNMSAAVLVSCYELSSGSFALTDFTFTCAVYAY